MKSTVENLMRDSKLIYKNSIKDFNWSGNCAIGNVKESKSSHKKMDSVNFVIIPKMKQNNLLSKKMQE